MLEYETHFCTNLRRTCHLENVKHLISHIFFPAVYYEQPETEEESPTSSPTEVRKVRDIPAACRAGNGRMKRSCVIIPPPPPKPTTPSKQYGTKPSNEDFQGNTFNPNDTEHYLMRVFSSNCMFWDERNENWINKGCKVSALRAEDGRGEKGKIHFSKTPLLIKLNELLFSIQVKTIM